MAGMFLGKTVLLNEFPEGRLDVLLALDKFQKSAVKTSAYFPG